MPLYDCEGESLDGFMNEKAITQDLQNSETERHALDH